MKKLFHLLWTLAMITVFCSPAVAKEEKTPKLIIRDGVFDGGTVNEGETIKHTFLIHNEGNAPLQIIDVKPG